MNVMQIVYVRLSDKAEDVLTARKHAEVLAWLEQWTPRANFKAVITESQQESLRILINDLQQNLVPAFLGNAVRANLFEFQVADQEVEDRRFWMPSSILWATWHPIP